MAGHHFLLSPPAGPAQSRLLIVRAQSPGCWILTRIHSVLRRHNQVQPRRTLESPTGCDTGSSGWVTAATPWNTHREWPNQLSKAISPLALGSGQSVSDCLPGCQSCSALFCQSIWSSRQYFIPVSFCYQKSSPFLELSGLVYFDLYFLTIFTKAKRHCFPSISATH